MKLWQRIFGRIKNTPKNTEHSKYNTVKKASDDVLFATNFTAKGGKFLFSSSFQDTKAFLNDICVENKWNPGEIACMDDNLTGRFQLNFLNEKKHLKNYKSLLINCEYLIGNTGGILVCNQQIKNLKKEELPHAIIIYAKLNQLVSDLSDAMSKINHKYAEDRPYNITTIEAKESTTENSDPLDNSNSKTIYLLLEDI